MGKRRFVVPVLSCVLSHKFCQVFLSCGLEKFHYKQVVAEEIRFR